jgi:hypothetical protein
MAEERQKEAWTSPTTRLTFAQEVLYDDAHREIPIARRAYERAQEPLKELAVWYDPERLEAAAEDVIGALLQEIEAWKGLVSTLKRLRDGDF